MMLPIECANRAAADKLMSLACGQHRFYMEMSPSLVVQSSIVLAEYIHTTRHIAIGVFYQSPITITSTKKRLGPSSFDFWGFIGGNVLRSKCSSSDDVVSVQREWCSMTIDGCHNSFDAYKHAMDDDCAPEIAMDDFEWAMTARIQLYRFVSGQYTSSVDVPLRVGSRIHRMLHLSDAESVAIDRMSYRTVMMFVASKKYRFDNISASSAFMNVWGRAETKLFSYRIAHLTQDNVETILCCIDEEGRVEKIDCDNEYNRIMACSNDGECASEMYGASLRAFLPAGESRFRAPFEMASSLVASRSVYVHAGRVYMTDYNLYRFILDAGTAINARNMARITNSRCDEPWMLDERTCGVYRQCFMPVYTAAIEYYGFKISKKVVTRSDAPRVDDAVHFMRLESVLAAAPPCMSILMDRAMNLKVADHNKYKDRENAITYIMRMSIPLHIVKPRIRAKVEVSYENPGEWKAIEKSIDFDEKRMKNPRDGKGVFIPPCKWIIESGGVKTTLVCPYASTVLKSSAAARAWAPNELATAAKSMCNKKWQSVAGAKGGHQYPASNPDEYTHRMIAHIDGKLAAAQAKRKI